jgi:hypothetical protein
MSGDNFSVQVISEGKEHFEAAVRLAFSNALGGRATHYLNGIPEHKCDDCFGTGKVAVTLSYTPEYVSMDAICTSCRGKGITSAKSGLILFGSLEDKVRGVVPTALPFPLTVDTAPDFLWNWLMSLDYTKEPEHDGSNKKGFFVTTGDQWGHVENSFAFLGVYPAWQMYGK